MARLPAKADESAILRLDELSTKLLAGLIGGKNRYEVARILAKGDKAEEKRLRREFRLRLAHDMDLVTAIGIESQAVFREGLIPISRALVARAMRGRPDAIKLVFEATGFHNPRVKHDHSGEIKLTLDIPRPVKADAEVVDADVVEE